MSTPPTERAGLIAGGNFIVDHVKLIEHYPEQDMLASIVGGSSSNGGGPYNVLKDLVALGVPYPLEAIGLTGQDPDGDWILADCQASGIDTTQLRQTDAAPTSFTDAMTVVSTGRRTFFHQRGANAKLAPADFDFSQTPARIFLLGYLMLLDTLDQIDDTTGRTGASTVLEKATAAGLLTAVDIVSTENPRFRDIALSSLPHTDYLIINEQEAGRILQTDLTGANATAANFIAAARALLDLGVRQQAVIHCNEGAVTVTKESGEAVSQGSVTLPEGAIAGATGAGDAFTAGYLTGIHENLPPADCLRRAVCTAASSLSDPTPSKGVQPLETCLALGTQYGYREF